MLASVRDFFLKNAVFAAIELTLVLVKATIVLYINIRGMSYDHHGISGILSS